MRTLSMTFLIALGIGCSTSTEPQLGDEFQLTVGEHVALEDVGLWLAFSGVAQDSRCARQATCVWSGDATVLVEIAPYPDAAEPDSKTDTLHTHLDPRLLKLDSFELVLLRLDPYPETLSSIPADAYIATFTTRQVQ